MKSGLFKKCLIISIMFSIVFSSISVTKFVDADETNNTKMISSKTRYFASTINLSEYWGNGDIKLTEGTGYFDTYQDENGTWWFVTPNGYAFYSVGRWGSPPYLSSVLEKFGSEEAWANVTRERIKMWGLNTFGCYGSVSQNFHLFDDDPIPYLFMFGFQHMGRGRWIKLMGKRVMPDVFDPYFWEMVEKSISEETAKLNDDPYLVGYLLGNELHWESSPIRGFDEKTLLEAFMKPERSYPGKMKAVEFLIDRYKDDGVEVFNKVWNMNLESFDELYGKQELGRTGWKAQRFIPRVKEDIQDFAGLVSQWFFKNVTEILHRYDPNHLTLGVRIHAWGTPREVLEEMGKYCDVISINYYRKHLAIYDLDKYLSSRLKELVPLNNWMEEYHTITGKPLLVAEWGIRRHISPGPFELIKIRIPERVIAEYDARFTRRCMESPYIIGVEGNYGDPSISSALVDEFEEPLEIVVERITEINSKVYELHGN